MAPAGGSVCVQEFLIDAGHEDEGISKNANWDTPLSLAVETSEAVATLLATRFPRCIPWKNKQGADTVNAFFLFRILAITLPVSKTNSLSLILVLFVWTY